MTNETSNDEAIVLNRMFTGDYLEENIGHEVINLSNLTTANTICI